MKIVELLRTRRFFPYFVVQAFGALNDNLYKNILLLFIAFFLPSTSTADASLLVNLAAGLFILPFFIFSGHAGWLADKHNKVWLIRRLKLVEIALMLAAAISLYFEYLTLLFALLFFMGVQSAYFGPVKYAILPDSLPRSDLLAANSLVEMGTFVAILSGTLLAGVIMAFDGALIIASVAIVMFAVFGWLAAINIPKVTNLNIEKRQTVERLGFWQASKNALAIVGKDKSLLSCVLLISWFWFIGASVLTQLPNLVKVYLSDSPAYVSLLLAVFSIAVGVGSLLSQKLTKGFIKLDFVAPSAIILALALIAMVFLSVVPFSANVTTLIVCILLAILGCAGGVFIVPLYTYLQVQVCSSERAQVIAANNIFNAIYMVASAVLAIVLLALVALPLGGYFAVLGCCTLVYVYLMMAQWSKHEILS
ncbi:1-acyl-sn-glycerol-3-phosphate acyltransferase [Catenovulum agarivorans DS-2]|uniref:1-acyl-sn-glycerol-3-phosphate acyltransferase n=1 Tax=Catenovulum agarivorans DS-2 TaxID=1328313 RepID=W7QPA8_9ALTE|nr:MFS transporter [Catenovulum agarivorans]EWH10822.1 1-acyl-sn-glycerol-3-phosphate acyltransferase [Catenovulum agarivorans DS-2]